MSHSSYLGHLPSFSKVAISVPFISWSLILWIQKTQEKWEFSEYTATRSFYIPLKSTSSMMECVIITYTHMHLHTHANTYSDISGCFLRMHVDGLLENCSFNQETTKKQPSTVDRRTPWFVVGKSWWMMGTFLQVFPSLNLPSFCWLVCLFLSIQFHLCYSSRQYPQI